MSRSGLTVVLVHGAWHGPWCWRKVEAGMAAAGVPTRAVELPLGGGLGPDANAVRGAVAELGGPVLVCGHSYGGAVVTRAASGLSDVRHLVYLAAFCLAEDETIPDILARYPTSLNESILISGEERTVVSDRIPELFYGDCAAADVADAMARLRPMPVTPPLPEPVRPAWRDIPSTYVVCAEDRALSPDGQRFMATRATTAVTWPTSHSPFLSRPELVVGLLSGLALGGC